MLQYQQEFIDFLIENKVLSFGSFKLKSGRTSPYFFNAGLFNTGSSLAKLGEFYAKALVESKIEYDVLFGPAYKGIPLVATTEAKNHGEGGIIVGSPLKGKIFVIDDVITAGTAIRESVNIINENGAKLCGVLIAIDRQEKAGNDSNLSAIGQVEKDFNCPVVSIVKLDHILEYLKLKSGFEKQIEEISAYKKLYGTS
ncbi:hypothetical protein HK099_000006 [Clydaea vesicula]|uniref:orotate phosphoribosyltransferase n=1 Tax=Clydaea vesicula TaxID=447962 RepID=A0AAD5Y240_9FUNG|nr:hypothetical protein HK099_000006 [Clydaea vesicula]